VAESQLFVPFLAAMPYQSAPILMGVLVCVLIELQYLDVFNLFFKRSIKSPDLFRRPYLKIFKRRYVDDENVFKRR